MIRTDFMIFLVDDDPSTLGALSSIATAHGYLSETFSSAREFLAGHDPLRSGCAVINIALPDLDGFELQRRLSVQHAERPIIFIAGAADIPTSVRAMRAGAIDFFIKPIGDKDLWAAVERAQKAETKALQIRAELASARLLLATLTPRERQVLPYVVAGKRNREIADELGVVEKTIKVHRGRMMMKLEVRTVQDLVRLADRAGIAPQKGPGTADLGPVVGVGTRSITLLGISGHRDELRGRSP